MKKLVEIISVMIASSIAVFMVVSVLKIFTTVLLDIAWGVKF